jgi:putative membrane protein
VLAGLVLLVDYAWAAYSKAGWLHAKLTLVALLVVYHWLCGRYLADLREDRSKHGARFYRVFNELPTLVLVAVVCLTIVKPF